ncbi:hypothetical protein [Haloarchaeobius amylolyticus]|uniref:hypothetical protein n=1 Tax=Haloarchaeobius amylolyticus TaxID=1198296 RepID=UPI0022722707|nr:hypothetical protein [Haloarchaeobius amylolyticus]
MVQRRTVLSGVGATLALGSLAGCLASIPGLGGDGAGGTPRETLAGYVPGSDGDDGQPPLDLIYVDARRLEAVRDRFPGTVGQQIGALYDPATVGLPLERGDVDAVLTAHQLFVLGVDTDGLVRTLADGGLTDAGRYREVPLFDLDGQTVAADSGVIVLGTDARVRAALDANSGGAPSVADTSTAYDHLAGAAAGTVDVFGGRTDDAGDGRLGTLYSWTFPADTARLTLAVAFADSTDPDALATATESAGGLAEYDWGDRTTDGPVVSQVGTQPIGDFDLLREGTPGESGSSSAEAKRSC